jgi:hypothetical protein
VAYKQQERNSAFYVVHAEMLQVGPVRNLPYGQRRYYISTEAKGSVAKRISGHESQGAWHQYELTDSKLPVAR